MFEQSSLLFLGSMKGKSWAKALFLTLNYSWFASLRVPTFHLNRFTKLMDPYTFSQISLIRSLVDSLPKRSEVLDVGSGGQWPRKYIELFGHIYTGCDIYSSPYSKIQDFLVTDEILPINDSQYDVLLSLSVLEHLPNPAQAISEYSRVLKSGGLLVLQTNFLYKEHGAPNDYFRFTEYAIRYLLSENGLAINQIFKVGNSYTFFIDWLVQSHLRRIDHSLSLFFSNNSFRRIILLLPLFLLAASNFLMGLVIALVSAIVSLLGNLLLRKRNSYSGVGVIARKK